MVLPIRRTHHDNNRLKMRKNDENCVWMLLKTNAIIVHDEKYTTSYETHEPNERLHQPKLGQALEYRMTATGRGIYLQTAVSCGMLEVNESEATREESDKASLHIHRPHAHVLCLFPPLLLLS